MEIMGGLQRRPQIHVRDVADFFIKMLMIEPEFLAGEVFNAVGENPSVIEIARSIKECLPGTKVVMVPERPDELSYEMDGDKIWKRMKLKAEWSIRDGVEEILRARV